MTSSDVENALRTVSEPTRAETNAWFFKTKPGDYGEGDKFIGVRVPAMRKIAKDSKELPLNEVLKLFKSPIHEHRLTASLILTYKKLDKQIYDFYLDILRNYTTSQTPPSFIVNSKYRSGIDGWDIVDSSAHKVVGRYIADKPKDILIELADSQELWQNRVAIVSTWWLITKENNFEATLNLSEKFLNHPHDLMHKATGWMLREMGKRDESILKTFLDEYAHHMPRTMLRYSVERLPKQVRKQYMRAK